ncbi:hypothetical protein ASD00_33870 [Ensifer sp. Root31]|uniref:aspartate/glutamate racemase family protein n=1 Tax=Ensifer sp. Root31 TaxID=1736512 RepID=UPI000708CE19|nr:aspartate/glutamate racemase family protein [Ensifer sp. Root31]KQU83888.1 hypothetical protein ASD00_33870 [Ensifer sp. Root31]
MRILVINPNSNMKFTSIMDECLNPLRTGAFAIDCVTLSGTPLGIETQRDIDNVIAPLCAAVLAEDAETDAFVIGCFADTGLFSAREVTCKPVVGLCEAGLASALNQGERFGVISTSTEAKNAELRLVRSYGLLERCVDFRPINVPVVEMLDDSTVREKMLDAGRSLKAQGADVLVLGCAGMVAHRTYLQETLGIPVVDPAISAVAMAIGIAATRSR